MVKKSIAVLFSFLLLFLAAQTVSAHHREKVLGESTTSSELVFPPVTAGPGFLLPDSPLFFLDQIFQDIRLAFAVTPDRKARVRSQIAGERLAELRLMLTRDNQDGVTTALARLSKEIELSSRHLEEAAASGKDVKLLARELNDLIKLQRQILGVLENQTHGALRLQLKAVRHALKEAKVKVEDELPEEELEHEIEEDLEEEIEDEIEDATSSARGLEHAVDVLTKLASQAAVKQQERREEALRRAIETKNETLRKQHERFLEEERKRRKRLLEAQEKAVKEAKEAVRKAQEAAKKFQEAQEEADELKNETFEGVSSNSGSSSSNRSGSSGSGSSGSGSGSSGSGSSSRDDDD